MGNIFIVTMYYLYRIKVVIYYCSFLNCLIIIFYFGAEEERQARKLVKQEKDKAGKYIFFQICYQSYHHCFQVIYSVSSDRVYTRKWRG